MSASEAWQRPGGRRIDELRPVEIDLGAIKFAEGSALISCGDTRVLCAASVERRVPPFRVDSGLGWVTAEYSMLPRATQTRSVREVTRGRPGGRTAEIQRLIGRAMRAVVDMSAIPDLTLTLDCDVLQADGGTRTAAITGGYAAMAQAFGRLFTAGDIERWPLRDSLAAISVGICEDTPVLDLEYVEDANAAVDLNVVATGSEELIEVQGTGEQRPFARHELDRLLDLAFGGIRQLLAIQKQVLQELTSQVEATRERRRRGPAVPLDEKELWSTNGPRRD